MVCDGLQKTEIWLVLMIKYLFWRKKLIWRKTHKHDVYTPIYAYFFLYYYTFNTAILVFVFDKRKLHAIVAKLLGADKILRKPY